jgi:hypothetical protein
VTTLLWIRQVEIQSAEVRLLCEVVVYVGVVADQLRECLDEGYLRLIRQEWIHVPGKCTNNGNVLEHGYVGGRPVPNGDLDHFGGWLRHRKVTLHDIRLRPNERVIVVCTPK